ncbi:MAG: oligosaccharide flippase family protein [Psychrilyobacter sp.]|uniref:oligosaccharide flippase family protein n=1 Tax=Psychrilyobacter sp. TaxID=2586924 RepID=UPI003C73E063
MTKINKKNFKKNSLLSFISIGVGTGLSFGITLIISRLFGAFDYGKILFSLSFITIMSIFPKFGLDIGLLSFLGRTTINKQDKKCLFTNAIIFTGVLTSIFIFIIYRYNENINIFLFGNKEYVVVIRKILPLTFFINLNIVYLSCFRAHGNIKKSILFNRVIVRIFKIIALVCLFKSNKYSSIQNIIIAEYLQELLMFFNYSFYSLKLKYFGNVKISLLFKSLLVYSFPLLLNGIILILIENIDQYMIGSLMTPNFVAIYKASYQFGAVSNIAATAINILFVPMIAELYYNNNFIELKKKYSETTKYMIIINLYIFGIILNFSNEIMTLMGKEFIIGANALIIISLGQIINSAVGSVAELNTMTGNQKAVLISGLVVCSSNILLNFILIPSFGIVGAAIASMISLILRNLINYIYMFKHLHMHPYEKSYVSYIFIFIFTSTLIYFIKDLFYLNYFIKLLLGGIAYSVIYITIVIFFIKKDSSELETISSL